VVQSSKFKKNEKIFQIMENLSKTVIKAIDVLETFLISDGTLSLTEISRMTGLNAATTYRLVSTLLRRGYLSQSRSKGIYSLGLRVLDYNFAIRKNLKFIDFAYLSLSRLCKEHNESVYLALRDGDESVVIEEVGIDEELRINSPVGKRLNLHCTAGGKILMASLTEEERRAYYERNNLHAFTRNTITDISQLERELRIAKTEGVAFDNEEYRMGIWAAAAPVYNSNGDVVAAAGILVLRSHIKDDNIEKYAIAIKNCAGEISQVISRIM
jgi:IclR family KDG regulon transcriptional repressor